MSNISTEMKEQLVRKYVDTIDFHNFDKNEVTVSQIKEGIRGILKQNPSIEISYKKDIMITEDNGTKKRKIVKEKVQSIVVAFIDGEYMDNENRIIPKVHKFTYVVG